MDRSRAHDAPRTRQASPFGGSNRSWSPAATSSPSLIPAVGVTDLRQRTADILDELRGSDEPVAILQRSQKTAYLVDADAYDAQVAELRDTRRALLLREVREAEAEYAGGVAPTYEDIDELLADLRR